MRPRITEPRTRLWLITGVFVSLFALLPLGVVLLTSGPDERAYVCRVETESVLGSTLGGQLQFLPARTLDGRAPGSEFVINVDHAYTRGVDREVAPGEVLWVEGTLMDPDAYFGEQYLFFGLPQIYVSQIKTGVFWPDQRRDLVTLYGSPVSAVPALYLAWAFPLMEEFTPMAWALTLARFVLVCALVVLVVVWRRRPERLVAVVGVYVLVALGLAAAGL